MKTTTRERRLLATIEGLEAQVGSLTAQLQTVTLALAAERAGHSAADATCAMWRSRFEVLRSQVQGWSERFQQLTHRVRYEFNGFISSLTELESIAKSGERSRDV